MASASGVPADRQRLIFRGRVLPSDAERLRDVAGFRDGDALHMVASSSAPPIGGDARATDTATRGASLETAVETGVGSVTLPSSALGELDVPGVLDALFAETARDLAAAAAGSTSVAAAALNNINPLNPEPWNVRVQVRSSPNGPTPGGAAGVGPVRFPRIGVGNASSASAYADPVAAATRHAAFVRRVARELASDPHGVSRGDGATLRARGNEDDDRLSRPSSHPERGPEGGPEGSSRDAGEGDDAALAEGDASATRCTHFGVQCDACGVVPIVGVRYKSTSRADYDLCETCHGAGRVRGVAPPEGPFAALRSPLPGLVPPPTAAPAALARPRAATRAVPGEEARDAAEDSDASATAIEQLRRRAPPVMTAGALASALAEAAAAARETAPALEAAAASLREMESFSSPSASSSSLSSDRLHEIQGQTLRASMAAHGAGSLLMELARLASSAQVAGGAAAAPDFLTELARGLGVAGDAGTRGGAETAFLAPPLVYLDPRGGTQPLSGMGARQVPNLLSGVYGGAQLGAAGGQVPGSIPPGAPRPSRFAAPNGASASAAGPGPGPAPGATLEAEMNALSQGLARNSEGLARNSRRLEALRAAAESPPGNAMSRLEARMNDVFEGLARNARMLEEMRAAAESAPARNPNGAMRALRGGIGALGGVARFAMRPFSFLRRRAGMRDRTRDPTEDFPERAAGGNARADAPPRRRAESAPAAGTRSTAAAAPTANARVPPPRPDAARPASADAAAARSPPASAPPQRSTFNFRFESNVRVARRPEGDAAAQQRLRARAAPPQQAQAEGPHAQQAQAQQTQTQQAQAQQAQAQQAHAQQAQAQQAQAQQAQAQAHARAAAGAQAAAAASFQQGIGALLNHLQRGGNLAPGTRMRLVPTAEGGFTLEPAGAAEPSGGGTATVAATPATPASTPAPATPDPEPAREPAATTTAATTATAVTTATAATTATTTSTANANATPTATATTPSPESPPSGRGLDSTEGGASASVPLADLGGPRGVGPGLPPRDPSRAPKPRPSELPRQDSLD